MRATTRSVVVHVLVALAALALGVAVLAAYAQHAFVDSDQFANRASAALQRRRGRGRASPQRVTDDLVLAQQGDLVAARPLIESAVSGVVGGSAFAGCSAPRCGTCTARSFEDAEHAHADARRRRDSSSAPRSSRCGPTLARQVEDSGAVTLFTANLGTAGERAVRVADEIRLLAIAALLVAVAAAARAFALSRDRRGPSSGSAPAPPSSACSSPPPVRREGPGGRRGRRPEDADAAAAVWDAFLGDLRTAGWVLAGCGAIVAAAAASLLRPFDLSRRLERAAHAIAAEPRPAGAARAPRRRAGRRRRRSCSSRATPCSTCSSRARRLPDLRRA